MHYLPEIYYIHPNAVARATFAYGAQAPTRSEEDARDGGVVRVVRQRRL